jgi:hypothetical protein
MKAAILTYPCNGSFDKNVQESGFMRLLGRLLQPVARLCLANGITFATVMEILKRSFVHEARGLHPGGPEHGLVSRVAAATGINRREVTRLVKTDTPVTVIKQPLAAELLARWVTDTTFQDRDGAPCVLNRTGEGQSFEALAQLVTRDVHPRSILDELIRLGLARYDEQLDQVSLASNDFVPEADLQQMLAFLSDNVGDHLEAAVENVTGTGSHLEQAVFADELSAESIRELQPRIKAQWQKLREELVPVIAGMIEADKQAGRLQDQRIRIGLYSYAATDAGCKKPQEPSRRRRLCNSSKKESAP